MSDSITCCLIGREVSTGYSTAYELRKEHSPPGVVYLGPNDFSLRYWPVSPRLIYPIASHLLDLALPHFSLLVSEGGFTCSRIRSKKQIDLIHGVHALTFSLTGLKGIMEIDMSLLDFASSYLGLSSADVRHVLRLAGILLNRKDCKYIITWSEIARSHIIRDFRLPPDKVVVIPPPVPDGGAPHVHESLNILFVANDFERKGGSLLLRAFRALSETHHYVRLLWVGSSGERVPSRDRCDGRIKILGNISRRKLWNEILPITDVFVLPSQAEGLPLSVLEAMSWGVPAVCTNVYAIPEVISDGLTGFLHPVNDGEALNRLLRLLIEDESLRRKMGAEAKKEIQCRFAPPIIATKLSKLYSQAIAD